MQFQIGVARQAGTRQEWQRRNHDDDQDRDEVRIETVQTGHQETIRWSSANK